jgi:hypothetical protein
MNVAGPTFDGPCDEEIHETDDRRFRRDILQTLGILFVLTDIFQAGFADRFYNFVKILSILAVEAIDILPDHGLVAGIDL